MSQVLTDLTDPTTGLPLQPLGYTSRGPVWPILGGSEDAGDPGDSGSDKGGQQDPNDSNDPSGDSDEGGEGEGSKADDPKLRQARNDAAKQRRKAGDAVARAEQAEQALAETNKVLEALKQALGVGGDNDDPAKQVETLKGTVQERDTALAEKEAALARYALKDKVRDIALDKHADADALLDSVRFMSAAEGLDPAADDYDDQLADLIGKQVEKHKRLRAGGSSRGGADMAGGSGESAVTQEQFDAMSYQDRARLFDTNPAQYRKLAGTA